MRATLSRRTILAWFAASAAGPVLASAPTTSPRPHARRAPLGDKAAGDAIVQAAGLKGHVSYVLRDAKTNEIIAQRRPNLGLPPASVTKAITAQYALQHLGPKHRFKTQLLARGRVVKGTLRGDLILAGGGDPTLDTDGLARLAADLKAQGIHEVTGGFHVYDGALARIKSIDPGQPDHVSYNPGISGLALNYNRVRFEWKRHEGGYDISLDARSQKYRPDVSMASMKIVDREAPIYSYKSHASKERWSVAQHALGREGGRWLPVRLPALYAGDVFRTLARSHGIVLKQAQRISELPKHQVLATRSSPEMGTMLRLMLKFSNNLMAEMIGLATTKARTGKVANLRASADEMSRWAAEELGMQHLKLVDHSGLGDESNMCAADMCSALVTARSHNLRGYLKPVQFKDAQQIKVDAKTGTLNFVSSLAGYITARDGRELVFAILTADEATRKRIPREHREGPPGARSWARRSRELQKRLLRAWAS